MKLKIILENEKYSNEYILNCETELQALRWVFALTYSNWNPPTKEDLAKAKPFMGSLWDDEEDLRQFMIDDSSYDNIKIVNEQGKVIFETYQSYKSPRENKYTSLYSFEEESTTDGINPSART